MNLGFIGTGKITTSVVTGVCKSKISYKKILLSPRNINVAKKITPVPGGVGPMTIACLMHNTVKAAYKNKKQNFKNILGDYF